MEPSRNPATESTLFDLASVTKPLATALVALDAWRRGEVDLEAPIPGATGPAFTMLDLLRHEAGFPAWHPLYALGTPPGEVRGWLLSACPRREPGTVAEYSCLGYILLGFLLEEALGAPLAELFRVRVAEPLGLTPSEATFLPEPSWRDEIAATELQGESEVAKAAGLGYGCAPIPAGGLWGVVNDGNARFLGGAAGNAGLFATARAAAVLAGAYSPDSGFLSREAVDVAWSRGRAEEGEYRTAGWKCAESPGWTSGVPLSRGSLGHEGYTGTGVWLDRATGSVLVLLTNRIHPRHPGTDFFPVRAAFLRAALENLPGGRGGGEEPRIKPGGLPEAPSGEAP